MEESSKTALYFPGSDGRITSIDLLRQRLEAALKGIQDEFDDHRESINDNTSEIESNFELLNRLESRVEKVEEKIEQLILAVSQLSGGAPLQIADQSIDLDDREKEIFLVMYTAQADRPLTYREIADAVRESEFLVRGYLTNMIEKGVPVSKRYVNDIAYLSLDKDFRERQAKHNIVRLSQRTVSEFAR